MLDSYYSDVDKFDLQTADFISQVTFIICIDHQFYNNTDFKKCYYEEVY